MDSIFLVGHSKQNQPLFDNLEVQSTEYNPNITWSNCREELMLLTMYTSRTFRQRPWAGSCLHNFN